MIEPSEVKARAEELEDANYEFRRFLKGRADEDELDRQFLALHNELFEHYDCSSCRNCCKEYAATMQEDEIEPIAELLQMPKDDFLKQCGLGDGEYTLQGTPCRFFLSDNTCQIEECKPQNCREYPFTNKPGRLSSLLGVMWSASVCPVVFEMVERLKKMYGFRNRW